LPVFLNHIANTVTGPVVDWRGALALTPFGPPKIEH